MSMYVLIGAGVAALVFFGFLASALSRFKRCPANKVLVIYGKTGSKADGQAKSAKCIHGGAAFVWPLIQDFAFLSLEPIQIEVKLEDALSLQNIRVNIPSVFTIAVSTDPAEMANAAERLLGMNEQAIKSMALEIITGQLRAVIATMTIEDINKDRDKFVSTVTEDVEKELRKIGLKLLNVNVQDIKDAAGYIQALGKEASSRAINDAEVAVAENVRKGEIGKASAQRDQAVQVADTNRDRDIRVAQAESAREAGKAEADQTQRIAVANANSAATAGEAEANQTQRVAVATANATATKGENDAKVTIANSDADRREKSSEAERRAKSAELTNAAAAETAGYEAGKLAQVALGEMKAAELHASVVVPAKTEAAKIEVEAEAAKIKMVKAAEAEGESIKVKMQGEAEGIKAKLFAQAEGYKKIIDEVGGVDKFMQLQMAQNLVPLFEQMMKAVSGLKPDKVVVWQGDNGGTSSFVTDLFKSLPQLKDVLAMAGIQVPFGMAKEVEPEKPALPAETETKSEEPAK